ncbi:succinylglutamate desuccinylase/aspartoacylase family protein [Inhella gelatinilytica]|uniref:Succinylglutamate desuccinylase/aspartoacylase family protein n=1 Tax=Inhella gelatinilytica TaxID=2795030 RepID=A0A931NCP6_9BURK|nr:succinylglutamate desuccinylase/aspartoacylase family protein [Inhella gelatinilytica]MBH9552242.1 succinylglutamate desuccinylase/aspartoacylase family protein [Inhella gelatinilytica]
MHTQFHELPAGSVGTQRRLRSLHFGAQATGRKAYLQAALHADEVPPLLVAQHLIERLAAAEAAGAIPGEIVLVPMANPIGLSQDLQGSALGRFDLASGLNFNRDFRDLTGALKRGLEGQLTADAAENTRRIRAAARAELEAWEPQSEAEALKKLLQGLALDADLVLDLHCDNQAVLHVYTGTANVPALQPLAAYLGAQALLTCDLAGGDPFDEALTRPWWELATHFAGRHPIALGCVGGTVELRGETEVSHTLAAQDASALMDYLTQQGHLDGPVPPLPTGCGATPLEGVDAVVAPCAGVLVFAVQPGDWVEAGQLVVEVIDPLTDARTPLHARATGRCFARTARRYATRGMRLAKVAGPTPIRSGKLLSP